MNKSFPSSAKKFNHLVFFAYQSFYFLHLNHTPLYPNFLIDPFNKKSYFYEFLIFNSKYPFSNSENSPIPFFQIFLISTTMCPQFHHYQDPLS